MGILSIGGKIGEQSILNRRNAAWVGSSYWSGKILENRNLNLLRRFFSERPAGGSSRRLSSQSVNSRR
jgi:hypothetical protein